MTSKSHGDWIFPVIILVVLVGFFSVIATPKPTTPVIAKDNSVTQLTMESPYSFEEVFSEIRNIDAIYRTDFRNETLNGMILKPAAAKEYLAKLEDLRVTLVNQTEPTHTRYIGNLLDAREYMLHSEIEFAKALSYGKQGVFQSALSCEHQQEIKEATLHYNLSRHYGGEALLNLDRALAYIPGQGLIGINEHKPQFYSHIFQEMGGLVETNTGALHRLCGNMSTTKNATLKSTVPVTSVA